MQTLFKNILIFALAVLLPAGPVFGSQQPKLAACQNNRLQEGLESCLYELRLDQAAKRQKLSVALVDITDPEQPRLAAINGERMMYAASLPKIAILLGAFERIARGEMELDSATQETLTRMIRNSSNSAATEMLNRVGKKFLVELLQSPKYRLYDPANNGGLWVGKEYGKSGAYQRDPLANLSHGANAFQVARFYYLMETGQLVSPEMSRKMKAILSKPAINHKFVKGLQQRPDAEIYRKSGSWRQYHADSAIIERAGRRYIAVALAEDSHGGEWLSRLIVRLDDLIQRLHS
ncbi:MAG: serine hydrolase [Candidatus Competibacterales bacterium]|nr:serine hydrolase [Candidatus Competibacterales bacterium]